MTTPPTTTTRETSTRMVTREDGERADGACATSSDAFAVLMASRARARASRGASSARPRRAGAGAGAGTATPRTRGGGAGAGERGDGVVDVSGSMFAPCPVCGRTIAIKHADAHVSACVRLGERERERGGKVPTSAEARTVKEDFRGRRSHTGKTTTGFVAGDELRGGWIERGESRRRKGRTDEEQSAEETNDAFAEMRRAAKRMAMVKLPGHFLIENFIDEDEERRIIEFLDEDVERPWRDSSFNGAHEGKKYGVEPNLLKRIVEPAKVPIPRVLRELVIKKFADAHPTLKNFSPNECNAINYRKDLGSVLTPHCDDRQLSSDLLVNLSLVCDCTMTYTNEKFPEKRVDVYLPRRSLQIQSGQTRYDYMHSIANENLHGNRRVSVTFRESGVLKKP